MLDLAREALIFASGRGQSALSALEANLPIHPALPTRASGTPALPRVKTGIRLRLGQGAPEAPAGAGGS